MSNFDVKKREFETFAKNSEAIADMLDDGELYERIEKLEKHLEALAVIINENSAHLEARLKLNPSLRRIPEVLEEENK